MRSCPASRDRVLADWAIDLLSSRDIATLKAHARAAVELTARPKMGDEA